MLLINESSHHLLACEIVYEFILSTGEIRASRKIVAYGYLLKATLDIRRKLLMSSPGIAPHSKMLLGLGVEPDQVRVTNTLPPLGNSRAVVTLRDTVRIDKLIIRLNAVVLENGQAVGPEATKFLSELNDSILKQNVNEK